MWIADVVLRRAARLLPVVLPTPALPSNLGEIDVPTARVANNANLDFLLSVGRDRDLRGGFWRDLMRACEMLNGAERMAELTMHYHAALQRVGAGPSGDAAQLASTLVSEASVSTIKRTESDTSSLTIYLQLIREFDRDEYIRMNGREPVPPSRVLIRFDDDPDVHESGFYLPDDGELPRIFIHRSGFVDDGDYRALDVASSAAEPLCELLSLAHELGHHEVVLRRLGTGVRDDEKPVESYTEEVLAWIFARRILQSASFTEWDEFRRVMADSLKTYEVGFKLDPEVAAEIRELTEARVAKAG